MNNTDAVIKDLHSEAALLLKDDYTDEEIINQLMQKGIDRHYAALVLENAKSDVSDKKEFYKLFFMGVFYAGGGGIYTYMNYQHPFPGGMYFVFWGVIVYGISLLVRAFILFRK